VDPNQAVFDAMPLSVLTAQSVTLRRVSTIMLAAFATLALILAAVGLYGVMAYGVVQRTREIGVRMALGARQDQVLRLVLRNAMKVVVVGETAGLIVAFALTRAAAGVLYGVSPSDPGTILLALCLLMLVALLACYLPARRAAKVDPMLALRYE
jgi:ABC-type antimicrobial peptide transport system permease subunit